METTASSPSQQQYGNIETEENNLQDILQRNNQTSISLSSAPALLSDPARKSTDELSIIQFPAKSISRSPRTRSLAQLLSNDEEKAMPPSSSLQMQDSLLNHFSAPSRISRSSTHQHLFTPELDYDDYSSTAALTSTFDEKKKKNKRASKDLTKMVPSKRGVGNVMTIFAVIAVIVFLFAGYPLTIYLTRRFHPSS